MRSYDTTSLWDRTLWHHMGYWNSPQMPFSLRCDQKAIISKGIYFIWDRNHHSCYCQRMLMGNFGTWMVLWHHMGVMASEIIRNSIFIEQLVQAHNKGTIKLHVTDSFGPTRHRWVPPQSASYTEVVSLGWRHHDVLRCKTQGPLTRYVKLQVAHVPGMPGTFSRRRL